MKMADLSILMAQFTRGYSGIPVYLQNAINIYGQIVVKLSYKCLSLSGFGRKRMIEGSLEVKLPTIWRDEKQSREEA